MQVVQHDATLYKYLVSCLKTHGIIIALMLGEIMPKYVRRISESVSKILE